MGHGTSDREALVNGLRKEHRELVALYGEIRSAVTDRRYCAIAQYAEQLHKKLSNHLETECSRLYAELITTAASAETREMVSRLRGELLSIGQATLDFVWRAKNVSVNDREIEAFALDLTQVYIDLMTCIQTEEDLLFPLFLEET